MEGGGGTGNKNKWIMAFLVATNVIASRPPERRPSGTPTACAEMLKWAEEGSNILNFFQLQYFCKSYIVFKIVWKMAQNKPFYIKNLFRAFDLNIKNKCQALERWKIWGSMFL